MRHLALWRWVLATAWLALAAPGAGQALPGNLAMIPTGSPAGAAVPDSEPLRVALTVPDPQALAKVLGVAPPAPGATVLEYLMNAYPVLDAGGAERWTAASFVIDFREPSVAQASAGFQQALGRKPQADSATAAALVSFVNGYVKASYERDFAIASEVAASPQGDCKAYAVLVVALARAAGIPARVALGMALLRTDAQYRAFGHAWAELLIDGHWRVADATLGHTDIPVRYLPFGILKNEGMGYARELMRLNSVWVQRVDVLGAAPAGAAAGSH